MVSDSEFEINCLNSVGARNKKRFLIGNYQRHVAMIEAITVF